MIKIIKGTYEWLHIILSKFHHLPDYRIEIPDKTFFSEGEEEKAKDVHKDVLRTSSSCGFI